MSVDSVAVVGSISIYIHITSGIVAMMIKVRTYVRSIQRERNTTDITACCLLVIA